MKRYRVATLNDAEAGGEVLTYLKFVCDHFLANEPCIIGGLTNDWNVRRFVIDQNYQADSAKGWENDVSGWKLNAQEIMKVIGPETLVPVVEEMQNEGDVGRGAVSKCYDIPFREFLDYFISINRGDRILYLKDFHMMRDSAQPIDCNAFYDEVPVFFRSDFLNEFCQGVGRDDYRFLYLGPRGSRTLFHCDVMQSYSWSANVAGRKRWIFFRPGVETKLRKEFPSTFSNEPIDITGSAEIAEMVESLKTSGDCMEVIQCSGETIFVPSRWYHQVENIDDALSINHNWINSFNLDGLTNLLFRDILPRVMVDIKPMMLDETDRYFTEHCCKIVRCSERVDVEMFYEMCAFIVAERLKFLTIAPTSKRLPRSLLALPVDEDIAILYDRVVGHDTDDDSTLLSVTLFELVVLHRNLRAARIAMLDLTTAVNADFAREVEQIDRLLSTIEENDSFV